MFAKISLNPPDRNGKGIGEGTKKYQKHNYSIGRDEWQQKWETHIQTDYTTKNVYII